MASVVTSIVQPEEDSIKAHLEVLFAPLREEYPGGLIELRYGQDNPNNSAYFNMHESGVASATEFAVSRIEDGDTMYVGVNPRKPTTNRRGSASDTDVEIAAWQFADIDSADALEGLGRKLRALPVTYSVDTGTIPHRRPHLYWLLDEPVRNMAAWTQRQRGIAATLGGDSVINPSRIMRLAGSVNFPAQHKVQRGYRVEVVTLKTKFDDEREPVTPDEVERAFPAPTNINSVIGIPISGQNTLQAMRQTQAQDLIEACCAGNEWHNNMIRLVAHLAGKDRSSAEILALADHITLPGYTVADTRNEMIIALQGARTKYNLPEPEGESVESEEAQREEADSIFTLLDIDELEAMPSPTWLIHDLIAEVGLTVLYGDPGAGKSFIALDMALRVSHGMDWHGTAAKATGVLYIAGEGASGLGKRVKGWRNEHKMGGIDSPFLLLPVAVQLLEKDQRAKLMRTIAAAVDRAGFEIGLIVVDTVSRALAGADENGQEAMGAFVAACDEVRVVAGGAVIGVHHSGKDKERGMRGSTVLLGACDASLKVSKSEGIVTLKTEKQKDAEEAEPIYLTMKKVGWATGLEEEQTTLVPYLAKEPDLGSCETISNEQIRKAFGMMADAWGNKRPYSHRSETRRDGRYAPVLFASALGGDADVWGNHLRSWLENECLTYEVHNTNTKAKGLRVLTVPGAIQ